MVKHGLSFLSERFFKRKSYKNRYASFSSSEKVRIKNLEQNLIYCLCFSRFRKISDNLKVKLRKCLKISTLQYFWFTTSKSGLSLLSDIPRKRLNIIDFRLDECYNYFWFRKGDLFRLYQLLNFPETITLNDRRTMEFEEVFLRGLFELASGDNQWKISRLVFGGDQPYQSKAFNYFILHVY